MSETDDFGKLLATNLVAARTANQMTQQDLADTAGISRATIAEIERGCGDPRLSTIVILARALRTNPLMLLLGRSALEVVGQMDKASWNLYIPQESVEKMESFLRSSSRTGPQRAAREGIRALGAGGGAGVGAAIGSVLIPGIGTAIGAALGGLLGERATESFKNAIKPDDSDTQKRR